MSKWIRDVIMPDEVREELERHGLLISVRTISRREGVDVELAHGEETQEGDRWVLKMYGLTLCWPVVGRQILRIETGGTGDETR